MFVYFVSLCICGFCIVVALLHKHTLYLHTATENDKYVLYIQMEYCPEFTLRQLIDEGNLDEEERYICLFLFKFVCFLLCFLCFFF
jgi:hypothetical protein